MAPPDATASITADNARPMATDTFSRLLDFASSAYPPMDYAIEDAVAKARYYEQVTLWCPRDEALLYRCAYVRLCRERGVDDKRIEIRWYDDRS